MYLAVNTRPDIMHSVGRLSQRNNRFSDEIRRHAIRIVWYLKGSKKLKLAFSRSNFKNAEIIGHVDADWGSDATDRCSYSGSFNYVWRISRLLVKQEAVDCEFI